MIVPQGKSLIIVPNVQPLKKVIIIIILIINQPLCHLLSILFYICYLKCHNKSVPK